MAGLERGFECGVGRNGAEERDWTVMMEKMVMLMVGGGFKS